MPHKNRATRLSYSDAYRAAHRPSPEPEKQTHGDLPSAGQIVFSAAGDRVQCHVCGRWYGSLNTHHKTHGLTDATYRETYGLARTTSLWPPALQAKHRQLALDRDQGSIGRDNIPPAVGRKRGVINRLSTRVSASRARKGVNTRAGQKTKK